MAGVLKESPIRTNIFTAKESEALEWHLYQKGLSKYERGDVRWLLRHLLTPKPFSLPQPAVFKVLIIGDGGVGKTTYVNQLNPTGSGAYMDNLGVRLHEIVLDSNYGKITFCVWDTAGQEKFGKLRDSFYEGADSAIIMFDVASFTSFENVLMWRQEILRTCGNIPLVLLGNKVDIPNRKVEYRNICQNPVLALLKTYEVCAPSNYQVVQPFVWLAFNLLNAPSLQVQPPHLKPAEFRLSRRFIRRLARKQTEALFEGIETSSDEDVGTKRTRT